MYIKGSSCRVKKSGVEGDRSMTGDWWALATSRASQLEHTSFCCLLFVVCYLHSCSLGGSYHSLCLLLFWSLLTACWYIHSLIDCTCTVLASSRNSSSFVCSTFLVLVDPCNVLISAPYQVICRGININYSGAVILVVVALADLLVVSMA
jgi:hypothetical protein